MKLANPYTEADQFFCMNRSLPGEISLVHGIDKPFARTIMYAPSPRLASAAGQIFGFPTLVPQDGSNPSLYACSTQGVA